jgi:EAL domain-containing protein (putative c-di-GMP-specific phosphodiesterase class I)/CheY-like chemotaxis protein
MDMEKQSQGLGQATGGEILYPGLGSRMSPGSSGSLTESAASLPTRKRIILADPDPEVAAVVESLAARLGCDLVVARDFGALEEANAGHEPGVILLGLRLGDHDAVEVLRHLSERRCRASIVLIGDSDGKVLEAAERLGRGRRLQMESSVMRPVPVPVLRELLQTVMDLRPEIGVDELRDGIRAGQFVPFFQPAIELGSGQERIVRAEVLARWEHPFHGTLAAADFIELAEDNGCMGELTACLLQRALERASLCRDGGYELPIALNIATTSLTDLGLPDTLSGIVAEYGFDCDMITIELTESSMIEDRLETLDILTRLRMKGFRLSMDDFGTGYSTLNELVRFPFNEIKIDQRFVESLGTRTESGVVISSAIGLAHGLGMTVCAEGVGSAEALEYLRGAGCDAAQGRFIQEPVSGEDLMGLVGAEVRRF